MIFLFFLFFAILMVNISFTSNPPASATFLRCEFRKNPEGIDRRQPRLSWKTPAIPGKTGLQTTAYHVLVASSVDLLDQDKGNLWDSGRLEGAPPVCIAYAGKPLHSFQNCYWKVKVWQNGQELPWSPVARWSMGILEAAEWQGEWIGFTPDQPETDPFAGEWFDAAHWIWFANDKPTDVPAGTRFFQKSFTIPKLTEIEWAEMLFTANDAFQLSVNGIRLAEKIVFDAAEPAPRFNLLPHLKTGENIISVTAEKHAPYFTNKKTSEVAGIIGVLKIKSRDGQLQTMVTDTSWQSRKSASDDWAVAADLGGASQHWRKLPGWRQMTPGPIFRKEFSINKNIAAAKIAICGLGYYELYCNGQRVGENRLDPAFTNYDHRALYVGYDLTEQLQTGQNALGVMLGNGWYNMHTRATWNFDQASWRDEPKLRAQLEIVFDDGNRKVIATDTSWRATTGPVLRDGIRNGEVFDARLIQSGWNAPDFHDAAWNAAQPVPAPRGRLVSQIMPGIQVTETIMPIAITEPQPGVFVVDMGTNLAGWARIRVTGAAGSRVRMRYSERLDSRGMINQRLNRRYMYQGPFQTDTYILRGEGTEVWEPHFTYHGFRYVEVTGWPGKLTPEMIEGRAANTAFQRKGRFTCSNPLLNQIAALTDRSYRSNFLGYPTDCPQREKNGWTGDAHLAAEQAMLVYDNLNAYEKWANDLFDARTSEGDLPGVVPTAGWGYHRDNGPGWGSAAVLIPWYLYLYSGDEQILVDHFELMRGYVDFLHQSFPEHIVKMGRGDWCFLHTRTPSELTSTALFFENTRLLSHVCGILGKKADADSYAALANEIKTTFHREFYRGDGVYSVGSQTAQALPLFYQLVPAAEKPAVVAKLVAAVKRANDHVDCGILGAKALFQALTENGEHALAYKIATQPDFPGYGYWISQGATSLWEDWDDTEGSFNHVMFGDIVTWFYRSLAGINADPARPGLQHILFQPRPVGDLKYVRAKTASLFGEIESAWEIKDSQFHLAVTVPPDCEATVILPNGKQHPVESGEHRFEIPFKK